MFAANFWTALGLTSFSGLSTGIGSVIAFFSTRSNLRFLSWATGLSGGVMLYVSFQEIMPRALATLSATRDAEGAGCISTAAFFGGMVLSLVIDQLIPHADNPHESRCTQELKSVAERCPIPQGEERPMAHLERNGVFAALAVGIHNFPEGLVTFLAALADPALGISISIAIALLNIPEGISVSVSIYYATDDRRRAFRWSLLSGMAEPVGALAGYLLIRPLLTPALMGILFSSVAGIMVFISLDELLPTSREYGKGHDSLFGLLADPAVMALSPLRRQAAR